MTCFLQILESGMLCARAVHFIFRSREASTTMKKCREEEMQLGCTFSPEITQVRMVEMAKCMFLVVTFLVASWESGPFEIRDRSGIFRVWMLCLNP